MRDRRRGYAALAEIRRADGVISDVVGRCNNMSCGPADDRSRTPDFDVHGRRDVMNRCVAPHSGKV
jgi:hypothetical protein